MGRRLKGQEVEMSMVINGTPIAAITAIKSFEAEFQQDILSEEYLGETAPRKDAIFMGVSGKFEAHIDNSESLEVINAIVDKARRRTPGVEINVQVSLNIDQTRKRRILFPNVEFGAIPLAAGGRSEYVTLNFEFESSSFRFI